MINLEDNIKKFFQRKVEIEEILSTSNLDPKEFATLSKELSEVTQVTDLSSLINSKKNEEATTLLEKCKLSIEEYADSYSKNQNIKKESTKRNERISVIDKEIESWKNLLINSEKMLIEISDRKNKLNL